MWENEWEKESTKPAAHNTNWLGKLLFLYAWPNSIQFKSLFTNTYLYFCHVHKHAHHSHTHIIAVNLYQISDRSIICITYQLIDSNFGGNHLWTISIMVHICKCSTLFLYLCYFWMFEYFSLFIVSCTNIWANRIESIQFNLLCFRRYLKKAKRKTKNYKTTSHYESWSLNLPWTNLI